MTSPSPAPAAGPMFANSSCVAKISSLSIHRLSLLEDRKVCGTGSGLVVVKFVFRMTYCHPDLVASNNVKKPRRRKKMRHEARSLAKKG